MLIFLCLFTIGFSIFFLFAMASQKQMIDDHTEQITKIMKDLYPRSHLDEKKMAIAEELQKKKDQCSR